jgi:hypothetical protein
MAVLNRTDRRGPLVFSFVGTKSFQNFTHAKRRLDQLSGAAQTHQSSESRVKPDSELVLGRISSARSRARTEALPTTQLDSLGDEFSLDSTALLTAGVRQTRH